jgi:glycosyltransferase involved in cell wall biosynthesis
MAISRYPFVSIIVPALNEEQMIRDCLLSLVHLEYPKERREILVVDNGSTDRTAEIVSSFPVQYLYEKRIGPPAARNRGIGASKGELIAFTDADCIASRAWLSELVKAFEAKDVGAVAGEVVAYPTKTPAEWYAAKVRHLSPQKYLARPLLPFAAFANLAFRREVFDRIGPLDEDIPWGESTDYCTRFFRESGLQLQFAPKALIFHRHRSTSREFFRQQVRYGRGHAMLYIKYRQEIPWGWRQSAQVNKDLMSAGWALMKTGLFRLLRGSSKEDLYFCYFEFLKKFAERIGFISESWRQDYWYF